jgi:hypothetical protein
VVSQNITLVGINMVRKALMKAGCLNEGEVRHHANHDEDLDDSGLFEGNEPLFPPNVLRPEDITHQ